MKIVVIDGQGGRMGSQFITRWKKTRTLQGTVIAVGTNSTATAAMIKAGADGGATGENPVRVNVKDADYIVGPIGILAADALLGEVTPQMATLVAQSKAEKILIPVHTCSFRVAGVGDYTLNELIDDVIRYIDESELARRQQDGNA
ncbi:MAG TPA: DUF3842 family protein [Candidatus Scybalocola faecigallinarum]|uniref:DUF3842 family protein n=1 Tax=Candidatus Scybalocola faecigallinarum TaxID=2840941 RepID=A0A9D1JRS8_9FIRM|nr:DUF3842 family protein [Candidatus Scybalocola faecigallinarum]